MRYLKKAKTTYNLISVQFRVMIYSHLKIPCLRQSGQRERKHYNNGSSGADSAVGRVEAHTPYCR
jgi:uncharacterized DUF497 family protein